MSYPDAMTTRALDRHNGCDTDTREADYAVAKQARELLNAAYAGLCELDSRDSALSWALTEARTALENAVDKINASEPENVA